MQNDVIGGSSYSLKFISLRVTLHVFLCDQDRLITAEMHQSINFDVGLAYQQSQKWSLNVNLSTTLTFIVLA